MGEAVAEIVAVIAGVAIIVWGAETFAEHLAAAATRLGVTSFALALLLAGAEPEELATAVAATLRDAPAIAFGDVIGANAAICLVALGVGAVIAPLPFGLRVRRYALFGLPVGAISVAVAWDGRVDRAEGAALVALYVAYVAAIWIVERQPPALGETAELEDEREPARRLGRELALVLAGVAGMVLGATLSLVVLVRSSCVNRVGVVKRFGPCGDVVEVEATCAVERLFGCAGEASPRQDRVFVAVLAGEVDGEAPIVGRAEVAEPAQWQGAFVGGGAGDVGERAPPTDADLEQFGPALLAPGVEATIEGAAGTIGDGHRRRW